MPTLSLLIGNIGSGKSILANKLCQKGNAVVSMDAIQAMFAAGAYDRYDNSMKPVYHAVETTAIESALGAGLSVVIDRTNMDRKRRERFIQIGKKHGAKIAAYDFGSGSEDNLARRKAFSRGKTDSEWGNVFNVMRKAYEAPITEEGFDYIVEAPQKYRFHAFDFDGTIVQNACPEIGEIISGTVNKINSLFDELSNIIIIWTNRSGNLEREMRQFLITRKIMFDFINENPIWDSGSRKIFAHEYYDDRNANVLRHL